MTYLDDVFNDGSSGGALRGMKIPDDAINHIKITWCKGCGLPLGMCIITRKCESRKNTFKHGRN